MQKKLREIYQYKSWNKVFQITEYSNTERILSPSAHNTWHGKKEVLFDTALQRKCTTHPLEVYTFFILNRIRQGHVAFPLLCFEHLRQSTMILTCEKICGTLTNLLRHKLSWSCAMCLSKTVSSTQAVFSYDMATPPQSILTQLEGDNFLSQLTIFYSISSPDIIFLLCFPSIKSINVYYLDVVIATALKGKYIKAGKLIVRENSLLKANWWAAGLEKRLWQVTAFCPECKSDWIFFRPIEGITPLGAAWLCNKPLEGTKEVPLALAPHHQLFTGNSKSLIWILFIIWKMYTPSFPCWSKSRHWSAVRSRNTQSSLLKVWQNGTWLPSMGI